MEHEKDHIAASPETARAEEMVDRATAWAGDWIARLSYQLMRGTARAREEAEDIWAEAQNMVQAGQTPRDEG